MGFRKEVCRNFQRGSCHYGERCKFFHPIQQQQSSKPSSNNPFGFGSHSQQKQQINQSFNNPFGFGTQSKPSNDFPNKHNQQFKPFENKWTRFSPISSNAASAATPPSRQPDNQPVNHKCTDPDSCKRQIVEDFQNEKPLWKLTCYGHTKNGPCDIVGDVSYEELRAAAYDDAKHGLSLQSIVERERNLLSAKLIEFENLLHSPYSVPRKSDLSTSPFPGATPNAILPSGQNNPPPSVSSFSQLGASLNMASGTRPSTLMSNAFGQPSQTSRTVVISPSASSKIVFGQPNGFISSSSQTSSIFGQKDFTAANIGSTSNQLSGQASRNLFSSNIAGFSNSSVINNQSNPFPFSAVATQITHSPATAEPLMASDAANSASNALGQVVNIQSVSDEQRGTVAVDASIWLKENWTCGEIPEEAPPDEYV